MVSKLEQIVPKSLELGNIIEAGVWEEFYNATWISNNERKKVAVKKISMHEITAKQRQQMLEDINSHAQVHHEKVLQILGVCFIGAPKPKELWIVTDYIAGRSLYSLLYNTGKSLATDIRQKLAFEVCSALEALHSKNLLHKDIKSLNFVVLPNYQVKLLYFGIYTFFASYPKDLAFPRWGAPETLNYPPQWTFAADIYSLGLTLYEIATQQIPFYEEKEDIKLKKIICSFKHPYIPVDCPKKLTKVIIACLNSNISSRPTSKNLFFKLKLKSKQTLIFIEWCTNIDEIKRTTLAKLVKEIFVNSLSYIEIFEQDPEKLKWVTQKLIQVTKPGSSLSNICFWDLNDAGCKSISEKLFCDSSVTCLALFQSANVGSEGMNYICDNLQKNTNITKLFTDYLSEEGVNAILSNIEKLNLSTLELNEAKISKKVYHHLFQMLKHNQTIKKFSFPFCSDNIQSIPHEWIEDCFQENFTLEKCEYNKQVTWFAARNKICNSMKASKAQGNSIPYNMDYKDIYQFLADIQKSSEELRVMKLMVLGDRKIGKTTLLNTIKRILGEKHQEVSNIASTEGIDCDSLQLARGEISIWDFGGEMEYTATHSMFLSVEMAVLLICFSLGTSIDEQIRQISFWLDFLNSSFSLPPLITGKHPKWIIILVGVCADQQHDFSLTEDSESIIKVWKTKWPRLPLASTIFSVSSLASTQNVQHLLQFMTIEISYIFDAHAVQIPSIYYQFLFKLKTFAQNNSVIHWQKLYTEFKDDTKYDEAAFKAMLRYCNSIGKIIWLSTEYVFTDPTLAPKIAAKFISPKAVRLKLLKKQDEKVEILDGTEVGSLLKVNITDNERLSQELQLIVHLKICFSLKTADSNELLYLFPSLSSYAGESKLQFQRDLSAPQIMTGICFIAPNGTTFVQGFFCQLLVALFQALNIYRGDIKLVAENGAIIQCPGLFFGEMLIMLDIYRQSIIIAMSASNFGTEYAISVFNSLIEKKFPQYIKSKQEILCETCLQLCFIDAQLPVKNIGAFKDNQINCSTQQHLKVNFSIPSHMHQKEQCNLHNKLEHNIFINYRVKTEGNKSQFSSVEPTGGVVEYLFSSLAVQKSKTGKPIYVFWDKKCLNDGYNWEQGFAHGLRNSQIILLLISNKGLATIAKNAHQQQDNVLFEYEAALLLYKRFKVPVFPIFLAKLSKNKPIPFYFTNQFPDISHKRNIRAQQFIDELSASLLSYEIEFLQSIKQTMHEIYQQQGVFMSQRLENKKETDDLIQRILLILEKASFVSSHSFSIQKVEISTSEQQQLPQQVNTQSIEQITINTTSVVSPLPLFSSSSSSSSSFSLSSSSSLPFSKKTEKNKKIKKNPTKNQNNKEKNKKLKK